MKKNKENCGHCQKCKARLKHEQAENFRIKRDYQNLLDALASFQKAIEHVQAIGHNQRIDMKALDLYRQNHARCRTPEQKAAPSSSKTSEERLVDELYGDLT